MNNKILNISKSIKIANKLHNYKKRIVLVGGCFDVLHIGHIKFLKEAKKQGDILIIILENDNTVRKLKGNNRPINNQNIRAEILSSIIYTDYIIILPQNFKNKDYDNLVEKIKPGIIATTLNDENKEHKIRQAKKIGAKVKYVISRIPNQSSSKIIDLIL